MCMPTTCLSSSLHAGLREQPYLVQARLSVAEVNDDERDGGGNGGPRHVEAKHVGHEHADGDDVREALEEQLTPLLRALKRNHPIAMTNVRVVKPGPRNDFTMTKVVTG